jgi:hypothetical protein
MAVNSLEAWAQGVRAAWGPLSTELVAECCRQLEELVRTPPAEAWLAALHHDRPAHRELYRDPEHGFMLLAHTESHGLYRHPHDHGRSWVIYAVLAGEVEMGTYASMPAADGGVHLVKRGSSRMFTGDVQAYLPGDIHDTLCLTSSAVLLRFTERDLRKEKEERQLTRYADRSGVWTAEAA